ncbi:MAG: GldG family protein [Deltaproteobacteria bacterium]|nr:GldG family protein [Deltaproteobacteria bacterium]
MKVRGFFFRQSTGHWIYSVVATFVLLGIIVLVDLISWNHNTILDLSPNKIHSLSPQTKKVFRSLEKDIDVIVFYKPGDRNSLSNIIERYASESTRVRWRLVDPDRNPLEAKQYGISRYGSVVVKSGDRKCVLDYPSEEKILNGILKVVRDDKKVIYFLTGHGERGIFESDKKGYELARKAMEHEHYSVNEISLLGEKSVPTDASLLIVSGPKNDLLDNEIKAIDGFISRGGRVFFMIDPYTVPGLVAFLEKYGIILGDDIIIDKNNYLVSGEYSEPLVTFYDKGHPITSGFTSATVFSSVRSVKAKSLLGKGLSVGPLMKSSPESWAEKDRLSHNQRDAMYDQNVDEKGPIPIAVIASMPGVSTAEKEMRRGMSNKGKVIVYGDSDFADNLYINILGNRDLFMNSVNWLAEEGDLISLRPKTKEELPVSTVFLTVLQRKIVFWSSVVVLPGLVLMIGVVIYVRRKITG